MTQLLFLYFLLFPIKIHNYISLEFTRKFHLNFSSEKNVIENLITNDLITKLKIGTPFQEGFLSLQFKEFSTYISSNNCTTLTPKFQQEKSTSYKIIKEKDNYFYTGFEEGSISNDTLNLGGQTIENFQFILAYKLRQDGFFSTTELGVLGLNEKIVRPNSDLENINFIKELKMKNLIDNYAFSIFFNNENNGSLIIGNYPHEYNRNFKKENFIEINSNKLGDNGEWGIFFDNITSGNEEVKGNSKFFSAFIYLENGVFYSNRIYHEIIDKTFFDFYFKNNFCQFRDFKSTFNYKIYICNDKIDLQKFPSLKFYLKEFNFYFEFTSEDLFFKYKNKYYFLIAFTNKTNWRLGKQFFQKYTLVFNQDKRTIGFYNNFSKNNVKNILKWIFLMILVIIILLLMINLRYKTILKLFKSKRIQANELEEETYYSQNLLINLK